MSLSRLIYAVTLWIFVCTNSINAQTDSLTTDPRPTGFLTFNINVDSALLVIDYDFNEFIYVSNGDTIEVLEGRHIFELSTPFKGQVLRRTSIYQDSVLTLNHRFRDQDLTRYAISKNYAAREFLSANLVVITDDESQIYYEGTYAGNGFALIEGSYGQNEITIKNENYGSKTLKVNAYPFLEIYEQYRQPVQSISNFFSILPGGSQFYKRQYFKSGLLAVGTTAFLISGISATNTYNSELGTFNQLVLQYRSATSEESALSLGNQVELQQDVVARAQNKQRVLLGATALIYAFNIFDALTNTPEGGFRETKGLDFYLNSEYDLMGGYQTANIRVHF